MLAHVASEGVFVDAHPQVIDKMGTKQVLYHTRQMSWGCHSRLYTTLEDERSCQQVSPPVFRGC